MPRLLKEGLCGGNLGSAVGLVLVEDLGCVLRLLGYEVSGGRSVAAALQGQPEGDEHMTRVYADAAIACLHLCA